MHKVVTLVAWVLWYQKLQYKTTGEAVSLLFPPLLLIPEEGNEEETTRKLIILYN